MHPLRAVSASVRAAALRRPRPLQQLQLQLVRVFSSRDHRVVNHFAGTLTSGASGHPLRAVDESDGDFDMAFTASRLGFPAYEASDEDDADHDSDTLREESREAATAKAERVLAILRHSMNELDIGRVIHRVSQFATTPRVTHQTRKQFLKALESRFGPAHTNEYALVVDFLQAKDQLLDELKEQDQELLHEDDASDDLVGFHPELVADPKFIGVVFCYCRLACLNSQKLVRSLHGELPPPRSHAQSKSSLLQVKHDFRRVLESEGLASFVDLMGIKDEPPVASELVDAEWDEFNLENDRIDFRMLVAQTQELIADMKAELSDETIAKMLVAMLASLKTTKLHRKIFQEMVCNIQAALPERAHARVLTSLVPFLSGNHASYADFESGAASAALQHHRSRHEAILRALLETRMRMGHVLIHDLDAIDPMASVSAKLSPEVREKVITTAWNIVSLLNDREYHVFFSRFLKHKLAWRPGRATFGQTFLDDVRRTLGPRKAELIMPLFEEVFPHLSVETLTICRVRLRHSKKLLKEAAALEAVNDAGAARLQRVWQTDRTVFYRNLPHGATETHVRAALGHIGRVARVVLFADPVHGPPDEIDDDAKPDLAPPIVDKDDDDLEDENEHGATEKRRRDGESYDDDDEAMDAYHDHDDEDLDAVDDDEEEQDHGEHDDEDDEDGDSAVVDDDPVVQLLMAKHGFDDSRQVKQAAKIPKRKTPVIASDAKTPFHALVEFDAPSSRDRALQHALQIFGVMMSGFREVRPVFASASDARHALTLQNIPFGTSIATLVDQVNGVLASHGLAVALSSDLPRGVVITSGRLELAFASFTEAAQVVELLGAHVERMKSRREPSREDLLLEVLRQKRRALQEKKARADERRAKREARRKDVGKPDEEDDEPDDEDDARADKKEKRRAEYDEDEDAYFAAEEAAELLLGDDERALREVPRPFDVTWSRVAREKNKHIYV